MKSNPILTALGLTVTVSALALIAGSALAQSSSAQSATAQTGGSQPLEEIVVTARRVEERLETVPISISVFNQRQLTDRNISSAADLAAYTPSLTANTEFGAEATGFVLRGFSSDIGTSATVGVYFDEVVAPRGGEGGLQTRAGEGAGPGSFFDLENVQVLKGPQGTLFGRNTTGGAILLVPQKPTPDFGGYFEAGGGNYGMEHLQGAINLPINDKVRLRVGFDQEKRDGYMNNISGVGPKDFNNIDYIAGRVSLVVDVTDDIQNYTVGSFSQSDNNGVLDQIFSCQNNGGAEPAFLSPLSCAQIAREQGHGPYVAENDLPGAESYLRQWQVINTTTWDVNDNVAIKNIASYAELTQELAGDLFGNNWILPSKLGPIPLGKLAGLPISFVGAYHSLGLSNSDQSTVTEELQAHGTAFDGKLSWTGGLYWEGSFPLALAGTDRPSLINCTNALARQCFAPLGAFGAGSIEQVVGTVTYRDYAAYGQATYSILDNLKITTGLRVTDDSTTGQANEHLWNLYANKPTYTVPAQPVCVLNALSLPGCLSAMHTSSRAPTWVINLAYTPVDDLMTYVQFARGYRTGGITPGGAPGFLEFQPEQVDAYEVGAKYEFRGQVSGFINAAAFYNDLSNQQVLAGFQSSTNKAPPTEGVVNGTSRIYGLELESVLVPYKGLTLNLSYTYLNSRLNSVQSLTPLPGSPYDKIAPTAIPGYPLTLTPHNKFSIAGTYQLPLDEAFGKISVGATYTFTGSQTTSTIGPYQLMPSYGLLNLNVNWESIGGGPIDAEFFMTNVTDQFYESYVTDFTNLAGFSPRVLGEPRMFGGRLRYRFGETAAAPEAAAPYAPPPVVAPAPAPVAHSYVVFFDFDKSDLTPEAVTIVDQAAKNAAPAKATTITLTGHTDTVGSDAYNMRLSKRRAESVAAQLEKDGIPSSEIVLVAKGKRDLLVPTKDGVKEPQNRRVTIVYDGGATS